MASKRKLENLYDIPEDEEAQHPKKKPNLEIYAPDQCDGSKNNEENQLAHMNIYGCLYDPSNWY